MFAFVKIGDRGDLLKNLHEQFASVSNYVCNRERTSTSHK